MPGYRQPTAGTQYGGEILLNINTFPGPEAPARRDSEVSMSGNVRDIYEDRPDQWPENSISD